MRRIKFWLAVLAGGMAFSCAPAAPSQTAAEVRATARATVLAVESAWMYTAQTCVDLAASDTDEAKGHALLASCAAVLEPARTQLIAADDAINAWTDATNVGPLAVSLSGVLASVNDALAVEGVKAPAVVLDAETVTQAILAAYAPKSVDAGKADAK